MTMVGARLSAVLSLVADSSGWGTALIGLAGVIAGSLVSYLSQNQQWTRTTRREAYGAFIVSTGNWADALGRLRTALRARYPVSQRAQLWARVNDERSSSLSAQAQVQMLGRRGTADRARAMVEILEDAHNRMYEVSEAMGDGGEAEVPRMGPVRDGLEARRSEFVVSARRDLRWWHRLTLS